MKKSNLFVMLLSAVAVSALASCGGNQPQTTTSEASSAAATTSAPATTSSPATTSTPATTSVPEVSSQPAQTSSAVIDSSEAESIEESIPEITFQDEASSEAIVSSEEQSIPEETSSPVESSEEQETGDILLNKEGGDHINLTFYNASKTKTITKGSFGQEIYVYAKATESRYEVRAVDYFYYYGDLSSKYEGKLSFDDNGFASFTVPAESRKVSPSGITFKVTETDKEKYKDNDFVGNYIAVDFGSGNGAAQFKTLADKVTSIDASGAITYGNKVTYINEIRSDGFYTENYSTIPNGDGFMLFNDYSNISSPFNYNYDILAVMKKSNTDSNADYSVKGERMILGNTTYIVVSFFYKGDLFKNALINVTAKQAIFDVTINYVYGESLLDDKVFYEVKKADEILLRVTYSSGGGVSSRQLAADYHGIYQGDNNKQLTIVNDVFAIYDGGEYSLKRTDNSVVLTNGSRMVTLTIDAANKTFVFVSDEDDARTIPNFRGLTFNGVFTDGFGDENSGSGVVFDAYENDDTITGTIWYGPIGQNWAHPFGFTATYDLATNTLAMTITTQKYNEGVIGNKLSAVCEDGKMTFVGNISSYYTCNNAVFTNNNFVL